MTSITHGEAKQTHPAKSTSDPARQAAIRQANRPSLFSKNWLALRLMRAAVAEAAERYAQGRLLDVGCGPKPYEAIFAPHVEAHVGLDHEGSPHTRVAVDILGSAYEVPEPPESFDTVLCTAVLEHLEEPARAIKEAHRVLRPGGYAIYTVPFIWHLHEEPRDFYRYSKFGLRYLFEQQGFEIAQIRALSGFWVTFGQLLTYNLYRFNAGPLRWLRIVPLLGALLQLSALGLDKIDRTEEWTWMYLVVARKP